MFKKLKFERNHIIAGIILFMVLITGAAMVRINYNEGIINSYDAVAKTLPERTKIGMLDNFWQKYTGGTRRGNVSRNEALRAASTINSTYNLMLGADLILGIAAAFLALQPKISKKLKKN